jgi:hypothetical protein
MANEFKQTGAEFLKVELETGLTFANIALSAEPGSEKRTKNQANALKAYETVIRLRERVVNPDQATNSAIQTGLDELRSALEELGRN